MKTWELSSIECKYALRVGSVGRKNGSRRQLLHALNGVDRLAAACGAGDVYRDYHEFTDAFKITCPKCARIAERTKRDEDALNEVEELLGVESENTGGGVMCFVFYGQDNGIIKRKEDLYFGYGSGALGFCLMSEDGGTVIESGESTPGGSAAFQASYIKDVCGRLGYRIIARPCVCGHGELDHVGRNIAGGPCWNGAKTDERCACQDYIPVEAAPESSHTPGPWLVEDEGHLEHEGSLWITNEKGLCVAELRDDWKEAVIGLKEATANAQLIAAAPEMLDALKRIADASDGKTWTAESAMRFVTMANDEARAVIAKARGL